MAEQDQVIERLRELDPRRTGTAELVALLASAQGADLAQLDATSFARLITRASGGQIRAVLEEPGLRTAVLAEIFRRMGEHLRADRAAHASAVVHWRLSGGAGEGGYDRWETVIEHGTCVAHAEPSREPTATITIHPVDFVRLITRNVSGPMLFLTGKLKIKGDIGFAAGLPTMFDLPRAD
jgi:putative sterol carrier protein